MARRQPRRQIGEERRQFGVDLEPVIDRAHARHVFLAHLLQNQPVPQRRLQPFDRGRHDIGHHPRALAAANHQQAKGAGRFRRINFYRGRARIAGRIGVPVVVVFAASAGS